MTFIKNLIVANKTIFDGLASLVLPALLGIATTLNPNETIRITGAESSWLCKYRNLSHFEEVASQFQCSFYMQQV